MRLGTVLVFVRMGVVDAAAQARRLHVRVEEPSGVTIPGAQIIVLSSSDVLV